MRFHVTETEYAQAISEACEVVDKVHSNSGEPVSAANRALKCVVNAIYDMGKPGNLLEALAISDLNRRELLLTLLIGRSLYGRPPRERTEDGARRLGMVAAVFPLSIKINWKASGQTAETEIIAHAKVSVTMRHFLERVLLVMGESRFEQLRKIQTGRGPLISKNPRVDFLNKAQGATFTHHRLADSAWHVITHSSTEEKIEHLRRAIALLGLREAVLTYSDSHVLLDRPSAEEQVDDGLI